MRPVRGKCDCVTVTNFAFDENRSDEGSCHLKNTYICVVCAGIQRAYKMFHPGTVN